LHLRIKLPYRLRYVVTLVLLLAVIVPVSLFWFKTEAHAPYDNTLENFDVFISEGMIPSLVEFGEVPPAFEEIRVWLKERRQNEGFFRTLWMPGERLEALRLLFKYDPSTFRAGRDILDHTMLALLPIIRGGTADAGKLLAYYNVKYIIVYLEMTYPESWQRYYVKEPQLLWQESYGFSPAGDARGYVNLLDRQSDLKVVVDKPEYRIYENLDFTIPHISAYNQIFLVAPPDLTRDSPSEGETTAIPRPVENWYYFYGYPRSEEGYPTQYLRVYGDSLEDEFSLEYLHGQTMVTVPELLSKIPNLNSSQHLLVFGEFLPSEEAREEYLKLVDAVIFLGDVDGSEEAKRWTEEPEVLLFVHEAESSLTLTPVKIPEETDPIEIADDNQAAFWEGRGAQTDLIEVPFKISEETPLIEVADDNQAAFWKGTAARVGSIGTPSLSNETGESVNGADSLKIAVGSGESARWSLEHDYTTPQDWSGKDFISLYWYGGNTGAQLRLIALNSYEPLNYFSYYFMDDFSDWRKIKIPLSDFTTVGEASWDNISFLQISMMEENVSGTWYLDRVVVDVNPPPSPTAIVISEETQPIEIAEPIEIADDDQAAFWERKGPAQLSNEEDEMVNGADGLKITVESGKTERWHLEHNYTTLQDWSGMDFISLYWYGGNTGAKFRFIVLNSYEPLDYFHYYFRDDFSGWRRIIMPLSDFLTMGKPNLDNITFLQISVMEENISGTWYLDRVVASANPPPVSASAETLLSYGNALLVPQDVELVKPFFAPRASYFRVMIRAAVDGEMLLKINNELLNITNIYEGEDGLNWYESSPIYLETGDHILSIDFKGNQATFDQFLILSTKHQDTAFKDIFSTDQLEIDWVEKRPSEYSVQINSDSPAFIVLGETYHAEWQASTDYGENLKHIPAFPLGWANGFYLPEGGEQQVEILFGMQETKDIAIRIWMIAWGCLLLAIIGGLGFYRWRRWRQRMHY